MLDANEMGLRTASDIELEMKADDEEENGEVTTSTDKNGKQHSTRILKQMTMKVSKKKIKDKIRNICSPSDDYHPWIQSSHLAYIFLQFYLFQQEMQGNSFIMLVAGYETTSTALGLASYELALNRDVQEKLQAEIDQHFPEKVYLLLAYSMNIRKIPNLKAWFRFIAQPYRNML